MISFIFHRLRRCGYGREACGGTGQFSEGIESEWGSWNLELGPRPSLIHLSIEERAPTIISERKMREKKTHWSG